MSCWFWNIDKAETKYFMEELSAGKLRQGWGYSDNLNLRKLRERIDRGEQLEEYEDAAWTRVSPMLLIKADDLVIVKNVPDSNHFTLVEVSGEYGFEIGDLGDYGHYLPVKVLKEFHKHAYIVRAPMVNALEREAHPIRVTYKHASSVEDLRALAGSITEEQAKKVEEFREIANSWKRKLSDHLREYLHGEYLNSRKAEKLIEALLIADGFDVDFTAGPSERGADLITFVPLTYNLKAKLALQIKKHTGIDNDLTGINQIIGAFEAHRADAGLLVTFADELGPDLEKKIREARRKYNLDVLYGEELYERLLELIVTGNANPQDS